jgi:cytoskeleton protein RodZ
VLAPGAEATETLAVPVPMADASEPVPAAVPVEPVIAPPVAVAASASASQEVVLTAQAESWVKVTDAKGVVALGRTLQAGETVEVTGPFPMAVVVGRVDAVKLQVRGQAYDMAAFPKDRVARFEVK